MTAQTDAEAQDTDAMSGRAKPLCDSNGSRSVGLCIVHADWPPVGFVELQTPSQATITQRFAVGHDTSLNRSRVSRTDEVHAGLPAAGFVEVKTLSPRTPTQSDCDGHEIASAPSPPRSVACHAPAIAVGVVDVH